MNVSFLFIYRDRSWSFAANVFVCLCVCQLARSECTAISLIQSIKDIKRFIDIDESNDHYGLSNCEMKTSRAKHSSSDLPFKWRGERRCTQFGIDLCESWMNRVFFFSPFFLQINCRFFSYRGLWQMCICARNTHQLQKWNWKRPLIAGIQFSRFKLFSQLHSSLLPSAYRSLNHLANQSRIKR